MVLPQGPLPLGVVADQREAQVLRDLDLLEAALRRLLLGLDLDLGPLLGDLVRLLALLPVAAQHLLGEPQPGLPQAGVRLGDPLVDLAGRLEPEVLEGLEVLRELLGGLPPGLVRREALLLDLVEPLRRRREAVALEAPRRLGEVRDRPRPDRDAAVVVGDLLLVDRDRLPEPVLLGRADRGGPLLLDRLDHVDVEPAAALEPRARRGRRGRLLGVRRRVDVGLEVLVLLLDPRDELEVLPGPIRALLETLAEVPRRLRGRLDRGGREPEQRPDLADEAGDLVPVRDDDGEGRADQDERQEERVRGHHGLEAGEALLHQADQQREDLQEVLGHQQRRVERPEDARDPAHHDPERRHRGDRQQGDRQQRGDGLGGREEDRVRAREPLKGVREVRREGERLLERPEERPAEGLEERLDGVPVLGERAREGVADRLRRVPALIQ